MLNMLFVYLFRIGLMTYADKADHQFDLGTYMSRMNILNALNVKYTGGTTNTADAIR